MSKLIDILPKIPQYEDIPYAADFNCPECDKSGFFEHKGFYSSEKTLENPRVIGWTETNIGKMGVFECPCCGQKFRFHCTIGTWIADDSEFDHYFYIYAKKCINFDEIKSKLKDEKEK